MPIIDDGMTREDAEKIAKPAPKGRYIVEITGFKTNEDGDVVITNENTGNRMLRVRMKIVEGPLKDGVNSDVQGVNKDKPVKDYNAVYGTGFMAAFKRAFPECLTETGAVNTDMAVGLTAEAEIKIETYEGLESNAIARLYPKNN